MEFTRNCPFRGEEIIYTDKWYYNQCVFKNRKCTSCPKQGKSRPMYGKKQSEETIKKIKENGSG